MSIPKDANARTHEYLYGRVGIAPDLAQHLLDTEGIFGRKNADGTAVLTFYTYAKNVEEARELPRTLRKLRLELEALENDLDQFIDDFDFTKREEPST